MTVQGQILRNYLVIDQGNTFIKIALFNENHLLWTKSFSDIEKLNEELKNFEGTQNDFGGKQNNFEGNNSNFERNKKIEAGINIEAGIISSVSRDPHDFISLKPEINWLILDHNTPVPIINKYNTPETLGKDRLAGIVAASVTYPDKDILVIDAGTAITYDIVTREKEYLGGSITPGLSTRFKALHTFTGRLPLYQPSYFNELTGVDTFGSIMSGVMKGTLFEMLGFIDAYNDKYPDLITILTGGDAIYFDKMLKSNIFALPNLIIDGLKLILQHNLEK